MNFLVKLYKEVLDGPRSHWPILAHFSALEEDVVKGAMALAAEGLVEREGGREIRKICLNLLNLPEARQLSPTKERV